MSAVTNVGAGSMPAVVGTGLRRTARTTGSLYLAFLITGILGFVIVRARLFADDPDATLSNLMGHESLARLGIALELGIVLTQTLTAVWFYRLFRAVDAFTSGLLVVFGMVNAVAILSSAALLATALDVAGDPISAATASTAATVQLLYLISEHLWDVAAIFFGLWLIPMGRLVIRSRWLPQPLGWMLIAGGVGYLASAFVRSLFPNADLVTELLTIPATIGELWIMGYLIIVGVRAQAAWSGHDASDEQRAAGAKHPRRRHWRWGRASERFAAPVRTTTSSRPAVPPRAASH